jgi:hypothetical protein
MMSPIRDLSETEAAYLAGITDGYTPARRAAKECFEARFFALSVRAGTNRGGVH